MNLEKKSDQSSTPLFDTRLGTKVSQFVAATTRAACLILLAGCNNSSSSTQNNETPAQSIQPMKPGFYYVRSWEFGASDKTKNGNAVVIPQDGSTQIKCPGGLTRKTDATLLGCVDFNGAQYKCDIEPERAAWIPALGEKRNCSKANVRCEWSEKWNNDQSPHYAYNRNTNVASHVYYLNTSSYSCDQLPASQNKVSHAPRKKVTRQSAPTKVNHTAHVETATDNALPTSHGFRRASPAELKGLSECVDVNWKSRCYECIVKKTHPVPGSTETTAPCSENPGAPKSIYDRKNYINLY